ncbi:hypothetical protein ACN23B_23460 [Anabaena sp. FACHB-709]|uniref:Uncharacterized protein n=2 Tax=Nostocaceae TaxID=1162 RepID=A0A1Z4KMW5_ANAVA|nr:MULTISPECIES: hypothetical protein [Nostocaceae]BAY70284.1 hypothetical protein NIES23_30870 [Trichormus variabilis NIES-23]HBW30674.1 hypothetical protein [Nostoc sp. UBA8866]MBD2173453.1 hypothetical protein [Anabaena cylindrica FACHB-318]MBD2265238.1 hypothetical protein [Anabaena sp. FACHB-709]MBD2274514.1 hypothetical protein [Nostoc sp. PCC 7120 = FACHB-418]
MILLKNPGLKAITKSPMVDRINDIAWQAHQGSVAAIIQLLNEKLTKSGVRIRAVFADGVLQLLCEAAKVEQLEQSSLVEQIQHILESIAPRHIRRIKINSRIVREQQLLWLTEIDRDRENQLLWSQEITLAQPNVLKQLISDFQEAQAEQGQVNLRELSPLHNKGKQKKVSQVKLRSAFALCLLLSVGWIFYSQFGEQLQNSAQLDNHNSLATANTNGKKSAVLNKAFNSGATNESEDSFASAVRLANQASASGKTATSATQWLELAAMWQRASDLMSAVPANHKRYQEAKIRTQLYKKYSEAAQKEADKSP